MPKRSGVAPRTTYHHGDLRRALLDASVALLDQKGIEEFTLREVARNVGVTHGAAYRHFANKHAVLAAVSEQGFRDLTRRAREAIAKLPEDDIEQRIVRLGCAYVAFALERPSHFRVMTGPRSADEAAAPELEKAIEEAFDFLIGVMREAAKRGFDKGGPPKDMAMRLWLFAHGYATLVLMGRIRVRPKQIETYFVNLLRPVLKSMSST
jgi:AcrR family transcriptional regulator